jgi:DNA primase
MRIPDEIIERIKSAAPIEDVVGEFVRLKKVGRSLKGLCPFHAEKTPSFNVHPEKGFYHCFGCGAGGNVFTFIMKMNNMDFVESVKFLGQKYGIEIPEETQALTQEDILRKEIYKVNEKAAYVFHYFLTRKPEGQSARDYLKSRNISEETTEKFNLGYAPLPKGSGDAWDRVFQGLKQMKFSESIIEKAQLARKNQAGQYYDVFRDRLMIPIHDLAGHVVGFGGRVVPPVIRQSPLDVVKGSKAEDAQKEIVDKRIPKYINSPESPVFHKSELLFGLYFTKNMIRELDEVIVVEGYFDLIMLYQKGVKNVVAPLGTALTESHINILRRYSKNAVLVFDPDAAGEKATWRTVELMLDHEFNIRILRLPFGMDPFDYLNTHTYESFMELKNSCPDVFSYMIRYLKDKFDVKTMLGKLKLLSYVFKYLVRLRNALEQDIVIGTLAKELEVSVEGIKVELERYRKDAESFLKTPQSSPQFQMKESGVWKRLEREYLYLLTRQSNRMEEAISLFQEDDFSDEVSRKSFVIMKELHAAKGVFSTDDFINYSGDEEVNSAMTAVMLSDKFKVSHDVKDIQKLESRMLENYRDKILKRKLDKTISIIRSRIVEAERAGNLQSIERLQADLDQIVKWRTGLLYGK